MLFSLYKTGFSCRCPECRKGKVFSSWLSVHEACSVCGYPLGDYEVGDGPAFMAILLVGAVVTVWEAFLLAVFAPPAWVNVVVLVPIVFIGSIWGLRVAKSLLISLQWFYRQAEEE